MGQILDTNGQVLADSVERFTIAADPTIIPLYTALVDGVRRQVGVTRAASDLAPLLGMSTSALTQLFTRSGTRYVVVKKEVNPAIYREIRALGIPGITGERTAGRIYPTSMAARPARRVRAARRPDRGRRRRADARQDPQRHAGRQRR